MNLYSADFAGAFVKAANTDDLDAAVLIIMEIVGIDTGDYASHFFDGEEFREQGHETEDGYVVTHRGWPDIKPTRRLEILHNYAMNEIRFQLDYEVEKAKDQIEKSI